MIGDDFMDKDFNNMPPFMDFSMMQQMRYAEVLPQLT